MDKTDRERMLELCAQIAVEQDQRKFLRLVEELNRILGAKDEALRKGKSGGEPFE